MALPPPWKAIPVHPGGCGTEQAVTSGAATNWNPNAAAAMAGVTFASAQVHSDSNDGKLMRSPSGVRSDFTHDLRLLMLRNGDYRCPLLATR
jgi:hypothetical protein